ncbi:MAG: arylformamidase [Parvicella sp.]|jgi:arylformamidase
MMHLFKVFPFVLLIASCATKKTKDISFIESSVSFVEVLPKLNIHQPRRSENNPVIIFIHGGYWNEGNKNMYGFLGRHFAQKNMVTVIPSYTLSPNGNYDTMAKEVAKAIQWTYDSISKYRGNPDQIFLMGHSAGGHLIALVGTNPKYLENTDIIKGIILNDAAGLDMYSYLQENPPTKNHNYDVTWTDDPDNWKDASPIYFLSENVPSMLLYVGTKTYPSIISSNKDFVEKIKKYQPEAEINFLNKKHVPMMSQFLFSWNKRYKEIISFIQNHK